MNTSQETVSSFKLPVSDFEYDVVSVLHSKLQGLEALQKYTQDAQQGGHEAFVELARRIYQQDSQIVQELRQILDRNLH
jgi:hypothetical protein